MLAEMGMSLDLKPSPSLCPHRQRLGDLVSRRDDLVTMIGAEKNRLGQTADRFLAHEIKAHIAFLGRRKAALEKEIAAHIAEHPEPEKRRKRLTSAPGVGPAIAAVARKLLTQLNAIMQASRDYEVQSPT